MGGWVGYGEGRFVMGWGGLDGGMSVVLDIRVR